MKSEDLTKTKSAVLFTISSSLIALGGAVALASLAIATILWVTQ